MTRVASVWIILRTRKAFAQPGDDPGAATAPHPGTGRLRPASPVRFSEVQRLGLFSGGENIGFERIFARATSILCGGCNPGQYKLRNQECDSRYFNGLITEHCGWTGLLRPHTYLFVRGCPE